MNSRKRVSQTVPYQSLQTSTIIPRTAQSGLYGKSPSPTTQSGLYGKSPSPTQTNRDRTPPGLSQQFETKHETVYKVLYVRTSSRCVESGRCTLASPTLRRMRWFCLPISLMPDSRVYMAVRSSVEAHWLDLSSESSLTVTVSFT